jgi:hypothetical protein
MGEEKVKNDKCTWREERSKVVAVVVLVVVVVVVVGVDKCNISVSLKPR